MKKTTFHIKAAFPKHFDTNVTLLDFNTGKVEFCPVHFYETSYRGRIWIDGTEIFAKRAVQLRRKFATKKEYFTWGDTGHPQRITALAICLYIFEDEQTAVNMYLPFFNEIMNTWERKSFEMTIDLTEFCIEHAERLNHFFYTKYFALGYPAGYHEINFRTNKETGIVTANVLDDVCLDLLRIEHLKYRIDHSPARTFSLSGASQVKPFDWTEAREHIRQRVASSWPPKFGHSISARTLSTAILNTQVCLRAFFYLYSDYYRKLYQPRW